MIIGLIGYKGSGKDTFAHILMLQLKYDRHKMEVEDVVFFDTLKNLTSNHDRIGQWENHKWAGKVKEIAGILLGMPDFAERWENDQAFRDQQLPPEWNIDGKPMTYREFLQKLGTEGIRKAVHQNAWVNSLMAEYKDKDRWIISDTRFPNEVDAIKDKGGILVRITRKGMESPSDPHESEAYISDLDADLEVYNATLVGLRAQAIKLIELLEFCNQQ